MIRFDKPNMKRKEKIAWELAEKIGEYLSTTMRDGGTITVGVDYTPYGAGDEVVVRVELSPLRELKDILKILEDTGYEVLFRGEIICWCGVNGDEVIQRERSD